MINVTETAHRELLRLGESQGVKNPVVRMGVDAGGCSGQSYRMGLEQAAAANETVFDLGELKVACDEADLAFLDGLTIDFSNDLIGGGFKFRNPNARGTCSCGTSFKV